MVRIRTILFSAAIALLPALGLSACASTGGMKAAQGQEIVVRVQNDMTVPSDVTVHLVRGNQSDQLLGDVTPNKTRTFTETETEVAGQYWLEAKKANGTMVRSRTMSLDAGAHVAWDLATNTIAVTG